MQLVIMKIWMICIIILIETNTEQTSRVILNIITRRGKCIHRIDNLTIWFLRGNPMYKSEENWIKVDEYLIEQLVKEDEILREVKKSAAMKN